jgi:anti-sigma B factor antagonist
MRHESAVAGRSCSSGRIGAATATVAPVTARDDLPKIDVSITTVKTGERARVVAVDGELDLYSAPQLSAELEALAADAAEVVLDLSAVSFVDSTALGAILLSARHLRDAGGRLALVAANDSTRKLLSLVGVDRVVPVYDTAEHALEHLVGSLVLRKLESE